MLVAKIKPYAAILFFGFFLLVGLFTVDHYGMSWDEDMEHLTSYVQYKYALGKLRIVELEDYEQLWRDFGGEKYYGQAISFPLLIVEHLFNFQLDSRPVYLARHTYNFLIFWTAGIFLYAALKKLFSSRKVAFFGVLLWFLCPRFWGESFYNNKDLLFCSLMMMSMSSAYLWSRKWGWGAGILWAIVTAFMVNLRIIGLFAVLFEGVYLLKELLSISFASWRVASGGGPPKTQNTLLRSKLRLIVRRERDASSSGVGVSRPNEQSSRSEAKAVFWVFFKMLICTIIFYITYVAIFPTAWRDPLGIWFDVYQLMRNYPMGMFIIFLGQSIHNTALPWHYLPVYFFATMPLLFSALILSAVFFLIKNFKSIRINLFIILCLLMAVGAIIMQNITNTPIYNGWRHYYFIFVPLVFVMTYALACFLKLLPKPATIILSLCFSLIALQMIIIHPYQYLYFNPAFISNPLSRSDHVTGNFERDYWGVGGRAALTWILNHDTSAHITVMTNTKGTYLAPLLMPAPERERLNVIYLTDEPVASSASYIVYNYTNDLNNAWLKDGWHPIWSQTMLDSYNIWSIHAREK